MKTILCSLSAVLFVSGTSFAVNCKRNMSVISPKEIMIEITVSRDQATGIGRISETLPEGAEIKYSKSEGGTFNRTGNKMNFVWLSLPTADEFKVAYIINTEKLGEGAYSIAGKFSYLEKDAKREIAIEPSNFYVSTAKEIQLNNAPAIASLPKKDTPDNMTPTDDKAGKVMYQIQIMSTAKKLPDNYFSKNFKISDKIKVDNSKGQFKYTIGGFSDLNTALQFREGLVQKGLKDAFLIALLNNKEISITEAKEREATGK